ncbi:trimeric intracellular cation channel family protein [Brevibacillus fulvus]|uniref:Membrane protein YeiH n=1 Tax=Brevibacillus fulvus TaxID=1125967 RepID=A0A939BTG9_9BACL|nr:trimeric intracellular cation channel family protein [Brevibacillus fulvus]MBM7588436.1 putative membrane protein YeiH [Brevibacillus fulvus]
MPWEWFSLIGTIAFAISGVIVAMEEEYDLLGVFVLGLVTAFGGGLLRNILLGIPMGQFWEQGDLFTIALASMLLVFVLPAKFIHYWNRWGLFLDAVGLAAFAIQGALFATHMHYPLSATIVAAVLTGIGGGIIRDVLASRKPLVFQEEIYAVWAMLAGVAIGVGMPQHNFYLSVLFCVIVVCRMLSIYYGWKLPRRSLRNRPVDENRHFVYRA